MKKYIYFTIFLIILTSCTQEKEIIEKKYFETQTTTSGSINDEKNSIGYTKGFEEADISAKIGGKITSLNVEKGDRITKEKIIGKLDNSEGSSSLNSSNNIINSLKELKNSTAQMFDEQVKLNEEKIKTLNNTLKINELSNSGFNTGVEDIKKVGDTQLNTINSQILEVNTSIKALKENIENTKNTLTQKEKDIYSNSKTAIYNGIIFVDNSLETLDIIFGITDKNKNKNDDYEIYLGAKNSQLKNNFETDFRNFSKKYQKIKDNYNTLNSNEDIENLLKSFNDLLNNDFRNILTLAKQNIENSIENSSFPIDKINTLKSQTIELQTNNEKIIFSISGEYFVGLKGSIDNINTFKKTFKQTIDGLDKELEILTSKLNTLNTSKEQITSNSNSKINEISTKTNISKEEKEIIYNQLSEAQIGIEALKKQKQAKLNEIDTKIKEVESGKSTSLVMIENGTLTSPINGIVSQKYKSIGETVGPGIPIVKIENDEKIKIEVLFDETENIQVGDKVNIEIDGFEKRINANISKVLPNIDINTKSKQIEILIENPDKKIKLGSKAIIYISKNDKNDGIIIPNESIIQKYMIPGVYVLNGDKAVFKKIEIIKTGNNFSQIKGLNVGVIIITKGKENISDGEILR